MKKNSLCVCVSVCIGVKRTSILETRIRWPLMVGPKVIEVRESESIVSFSRFLIAFALLEQVFHGKGLIFP